MLRKATVGSHDHLWAAEDGAGSCQQEPEQREHSVKQNCLNKSCGLREPASWLGSYREGAREMNTPT